MKVQLLICGCALIAMLSVAAVLVSQEPSKPSSNAKAAIMRLKLEPAKKILEGIALADFQSIRKSTEQIRLLTLDAGWMIVQDESYRKHTADFERSLNLLKKMADEKEMEGVMLAYMQVTMRCVECHRTLRDANK